MARLYDYGVELNAAERALLEQFESEFASLDGLIPLNLTLSRVQCFFLLSQLQLALRHPDNVGPAAEFARAVAQTLEDAVAISPALREMARRGWDYP